VFATIGQFLLAADRLRARAAEQLSGSGGATAAPPAQPAPAEAPRVKPAAPRTAPAHDAETTRWRSLDKTGNVRLLDGNEEQDEEDLAVPATSAGSESSVAEPPAAAPVTQAVPEAVPAPAEHTPTEPVQAVSAQTEPVSPDPALDGTATTSPAEQAPAGLAPVPDPASLAPAVPEPSDLAPVPDPASLAPAVPEPSDLAPVPDPAVPDPAVPDPAVVAEPSAAAGEALPVPNYDQLSVASLRARLRVLDATQVQVLLDYEKAHEGRPAVITMFERRLTKLSEGS
jgi:hypothetical protein